MLHIANRRILKHPPGNFCWIDLGAADRGGAMDFYKSLFGWAGGNGYPFGSNNCYMMCSLQYLHHSKWGNRTAPRDVAAIYTLRPDQVSHRVPPHWMLYVAVDDADVAAARAAELGAKVLVPPSDSISWWWVRSETAAGGCYPTCRVAVLQDPTGADFCVLQPMRTSGIEIAGVDGTLCWADLNTPNRVRAGEFYSSLFGWQFTKREKDAPNDYWEVKNGEEFIGGFSPAAQPQRPPRWLPYFKVADCDATSNNSQRLGATVSVPPMSVKDIGRVAVLMDPQGAAFGIFQLTP
jgi:predicted enzyme related to lactoylglutathione lyase